MGNILTYIKWRGDLTFREREFCEVDNLILSLLSYVQLKGIVPEKGSDGSISISECLKAYYAADYETEDEKYFDLLEALASSRRFRNIKLSNYQEVHDEETQTDFVALCAEPGDGTMYVSYCGTRAFIMAWQEDFSMSYQIMPSQTLAVSYLEDIISRTKCNLRIGGHSKGGNLAVYAAMHVSEEMQERILDVYSNDGPGFCEDIIDGAGLEAIRSKVKRIVPKYCVIGALFEPDIPKTIVESSNEGIMQHDGFSWQIEGDSFVEAKKEDEDSQFVNQIFADWIVNADMRQRESFTNDFFGALQAGGAKSVGDLAKGSVLDFEDVLFSIVESQDSTRKSIGDFIKTVVQAFARIDYRKLLSEQKMIYGIVCMVLGVFFMRSPEAATNIIGGIVGMIAVVWLGKLQMELAFTEKKNQRYAKAKMILHMVLMCVIVFLIGQQVVLISLSNFLIGGVFLYHAYRFLKKGMEEKGKIRYIAYALAIIAFLLGIFPIVVKNVVMWQYVYAAGSVVLIYGVTYIVYEMYENGKQDVKQKRSHHMQGKVKKKL